MIKELIFVGIFLFLLLFRPTVIPVDLIYVLTLFSAVMTARHLAKNRSLLNKITQNKLVRVYVGALFLFTALSCAALTYELVVSGSSAVMPFIMSIARLGLTFVLFPINILWVLLYCRSKKIYTDTLLKILFYVIVAQLVLVLAAYLLPPVKDFIIWLMQINGDWTERWTLNRSGEYRMFGFAKSLFDTYGFGLGILSAIPWMIAYRQKDLKYLMVLPLIFFATLINARTGLVIMGIVSLMMVIFYALNYKHFLKKSLINNKVLIGLMATAVAVFIGTVGFINNGGYLASNIGKEFSGYANFILSGGDIEAARGTQAAKHLSSEWWTVPRDPVQLAIGAGQSVYGSDSIQDFSTDVGYVNNIWLIGFLGTVLLHVVIIRMLWQYRPLETYGAYIAVAFVVSILVFQIKGSALWSANLGVSSIMLIYAIGSYKVSIGESGVENE